MTLPQGRYEVRRTLAVGSTCELSEALDTTTGEVVALRRLLPLFAAEQAFADRFEAEARRMLGFQHAHVVRVLDVGRDAQGPFVACELVGGVTLRLLLDRTSARGAPLEWPLAATLVSQVARGLAALQVAKGDAAPHGGVSSEHVLLSREGEVKLVDATASRALAGRTQNPDGTSRRPARFAAPELLRRESADARADVWALGVLLSEALTGEVPFDAQTDAAAVEAMLSAPLSPLKDLGVDAPAAVEAVLRRALERALHHRLPSVAELASGLEAALAEAPRVSPGALGELVARTFGTGAAVAPGDPSSFVSTRALGADGAMVRLTPEKAGAPAAPEGLERFDLARAPVPRSTVMVPELPPMTPSSSDRVSKLELPDEGLPPLKMPENVERGLHELATKRPARPSSRVHPAALVAGALLVGGAAWFLFLKEPPKAGGREGAGSAAALPPTPSSGPALVPPAGLGPVTLAPARHLAPTLITIDSRPPHAEVTVNGALVGHTPWEGDTDPTSPLIVSLSLKGYEPWSVSLDAGVDLEQTVALERSRAR